MRYDEFRDRLQEALHETRVIFSHERPSETVELESMDRGWKVYVWRGERTDTEPFGVSAKISFNWRALNAARGQTCEEDVLTEILGRRIRTPKTEGQWVRVDLKLHASLPYGSTARFPEPQVLSSWTVAVGKRFDELLTDFKERDGRIVAVMGGRGDIEVKIQVTAQGELSLAGVSVRGFQLVRVPRVWDDPDRRDTEKGNANELARLAMRFKQALEDWGSSIAELGNWIRYSPPPPEAKPLEPWFDDEEEDAGPETIH